MVHRLFIYRVLAREPKRTRLLPTVLDLRPGILPLSNRNHCIALEQLSGQQLPYTDIDSFFVTGPTSQPFAGWSEVSLVWKDGIIQRKESARPEQRPTKTVIT